MWNINLSPQLIRAALNFYSAIVDVQTRKERGEEEEEEEIVALEQDAEVKDDETGQAQEEEDDDVSPQQEATPGGSANIDYQQQFMKRLHPRRVTLATHRVNASSLTSRPLLLSLALQLPA